MIKTYNVTVNGVCYEVEVEELAKNNTINENTQNKEVLNTVGKPTKDNVVNIDKNSKGNILSPMPGVVNKINVSKSQSVSKGEVLLILEAMKMENEIVSPIDGIIKDIYILEKSTVNSGELLISIE